MMIMQAGSFIRRSSKGWMSDFSARISKGVFYLFVAET
jgi:hypothetical protein